MFVVQDWTTNLEGASDTIIEKAIWLDKEV